VIFIILVNLKHVTRNAQNGTSRTLYNSLVSLKSYSNQITFKTSFQNCVLKALQNRQWRQIDTTGWNLQWSEKERVNDVFEEGLAPHQRCNHFRLWGQVCNWLTSFAERICSLKTYESIRENCRNKKIVFKSNGIFYLLLSSYLVSILCLLRILRKKEDFGS
jgi:hypothetical protein